MANSIKQFRWYGEQDSRNFPSWTAITEEEMTEATKYKTGAAFDNVYPITQLGIQTLSGVKFYLNGSVNPITIGASGIYDLNVQNGMRITRLEFDQESLSRINENGYLLIDIIYETNKEED